MNIILKHTLRSAGRNRTQAAVITVTVIIVTVMIFVSLSMSDIFFTINMSEADRVAQGADMLLGDNNGGGETFSGSRVKQILAENPSDIDYAEYFIKLPTIMKTGKVSKTVLVEATDLKSYFNRHTLNYVARYDGKREGAPVTPGEDIGIEYKAAVVGNNFAKSAGISAGDTIEIYLPTYDSYAKLTVLYIASDEGIFGGAAAVNILTDFTAVGNQGQVNAVYINFTDGKLFEKYEKIFAGQLPNIECSEGNNLSGVLAIVRSNTLLLAVGLIFAIAVMMLIQLTSYLIIARNRMDEMVVFKAAGATPTQVTAIMLAEVVFYGLLGGLIGITAGRLVMEIVIMKLLPTARGAISYAAWKYIVSVIITVLVSLAAALAPLISASRRSIRDLTSAGAKEAGKGRPVLLSVFSAILIGGAVAMQFLTGIGVTIISGVLVAVIAGWLSLAIPYAVRLFSLILGKIRDRGTAGLAAVSIKRNRAMRTVTLLLAVVISFSFLVYQAADIVKKAVTPYGTRFDADYVVSVNSNLNVSGYEAFNGKILALEGIGGSVYVNSATFYMPEDTEKLFTLYGVQSAQALDYCCSGGVSPDTGKNWEEAESPLVLSQDMMLRYGYKVGERITVKAYSKDFEGVEFTFTIAGVDYSVTEYDRVGYASFDIINGISKTAFYLVKAEDISIEDGADRTFLNLRSAVEEMTIDGKRLEKSYALTFDEWAYGGRRNLRGVTALLSFIQAAIYIVVIMGLINIAVVTVYDRKRETRLYRLSGMSPYDYIRFSFFEAGVTSFAGGTAGILITIILNRFLPVMGALVDKYMAFGAVPVPGIITGIAGCLLFTTVWALIALARKKDKPFSINERLN